MFLSPDHVGPSAKFVFVLFPDLVFPNIGYVHGSRRDISVRIFTIFTINYVGPEQRPAALGQNSWLGREYHESLPEASRKHPLAVCGQRECKKNVRKM